MEFRLPVLGLNYEPMMFLRLVNILLYSLIIGGATLEANEETPMQPKSTTPASSVNFSDFRSVECGKISADFVECNFNISCVYGELDTVDCRVDRDIPCIGEHAFQITFPCLYCWQVPEDHYTCAKNTSCKINSRYLSTCNINSTTYCLGLREFRKYHLCNISNGQKKSTALSLSILFGGFGVDRFYLGHWQEGVGKLFSFGGFGVWTLIDTILISIGYLKPADTSQYEP